ncbi:MAG: response regulator [Candidatus Caenarcaniphilales bacterium]|nr:response regulator [Candidatus Caenarcaniphilales bacterium]
MKDPTKHYYKYSLILSLSLLIGLLFASSFYLISELNKFSNYPKVLQASQRQLTLSQKLLAQVAIATFNTNFEKRSYQVNKIEKSLSRFTKSNNLLRGQARYISSSGLNANNIFKKYIEIDNQISILKNKSNELIELIHQESAQKLLVDKFHEIESSHKDLFNEISNVHSFYLSESEKRINHLKFSIFLIFFLIIFTSFILWKLIVQPTSNKIRNEIENTKEEVSELTSISKEALKKIDLKNKVLQTLNQETRISLNGIIGMTEMLFDTPLTNEQKEYLTSVSNSAIQIQAVLDDALDLFKIEQGNFEIRTSYLDLRRIIEDCCEALSSKSENKSIEILTNYPVTQETHFIGDAKRIRQIITNLLNIFLEVSNNGCINIQVHCESPDELYYQSNAKINFSVQSDFTTKIDELEDLSNNGLDLTFQTAQKLADLMDGTIEFHGADSNKAFELKLNIPLPIDRNFNRSNDEKIFKSIQGNEILIIDNNKTTRESLLSSLKSMKFEASATTSVDYTIIDIAKRKRISENKLILLVNLEDNVEQEINKLINEDCFNDIKVLVSVSPSHRELINRRKDRYKDLKILYKPIRMTKLIEYCCELNNLDRISIPPVSQISKTNKVKALVVEDYIINQKVITHMLQKLGCDVTTVSGGVNALEKLKETKYEIIFMDSQMPGMNGYQTTQEIRCSSNEVKDIPIIGMISNVSSSEKDKCISSGMNAFIETPIKVEDLESMLISFVPQSNCSIENFLTKGEIENIGKADFICNVIEKFINSTKDDLDYIEKALSNNDYKKVKLISNRIKGSAAQLGANRLESICEQIEDQSNQSSINKLHKDLLREFEKIKISK